MNFKNLSKLSFIVLLFFTFAISQETEEKKPEYGYLGTIRWLDGGILIWSDT